MRAVNFNINIIQLKKKWLKCLIIPLPAVVIRKHA